MPLAAFAPIQIVCLIQTGYMKAIPNGFVMIQIAISTQVYILTKKASFPHNAFLSSGTLRR